MTETGPPSRGGTLHVALRLRQPIELKADVAVAPGHMVALVGPSGVGKSSVLRAVAGVLPHAQGEIHLGQQVWLDSARSQWLTPQARRVGYMPQQFGLFPHLCARDNIEAGLLDLPRAERRVQARDWLQRVGLEGKAQQLPHQLSGGEQQRVALARACARRPSVLLLDEPFSAVDWGTRQRLYETFARWRAEAGVPVLVVTHDVPYAEQFADSVVVFEPGQALPAVPTPRGRAGPGAA